VIAGQLVGETEERHATALKSAAQFGGLPGRRRSPQHHPVVNNGMHVEIKDRPQAYDRQGRSGRRRRHSCWNRRSTISTWRTARDRRAEDKVLVYRNTLGLMNRHAVGDFEKAARPSRARSIRTASTRRRRQGADTHGRSLLLMAHVGHHMFTTPCPTKGEKFRKAS